MMTVYKWACTYPDCGCVTSCMTEKHMNENALKHLDQAHLIHLHRWLDRHAEAAARFGPMPPREETQREEVGVT